MFASITALLSTTIAFDGAFEKLLAKNIFLALVQLLKSF